MKTMCKYRVKVVPNDNPNAEGEWVVIYTSTKLEFGASSFTSGHHIVAIEKTEDPTGDL